MLTKTLSLTSTVVQSEGNVVSDMDGCKVMLSIALGKYYNLGTIGGDIWDMMEAPIKVEAIIKQLISNYEVEESVCIDHVQSFLGQLIKEKLVIVSE